MPQARKIVPTRLEIRRGRRQARERFQKARLAERRFARQLSGVARQCGVIASGLMGTRKEFDSEVARQIRATLAHYAEILRPWAASVAERMLREVDRRDADAWVKASEAIGLGLREQIRSVPTAAILRDLKAEQVELITSLPREAAERVHRFTVEAMLGSRRADEAAAAILATGHVTASRARLIARTETTRTATAMTEARALHVGSDAYIWRTAEDEDVRPLHRKLNGKTFRWAEPPVAGENGERAHPGAIYYCRCYAEPILPEEV